MRIFLIAALVLLTTGCADFVTFEQALTTEAVGFWHGLWHGIIIFFAFVGSLIWDDVAIYAIYNTGGWYDFGFYLGAISVPAAVSTGRKK